MKETTRKDIVRQYGDVLTDGQKVVEYELEIIPVSPAINLILGGGVPAGSFVSLTGGFKAGKTVTALWIARNAQRMGYNVVYENIEGRLKPRDLKGIRGLDSSKVVVIGSTRDKVLAAHEYLQIADTILHGEEKAVVILDSVSQLVSIEELTAGVNERQRAPVASLMSRFIRKVSAVLPANKNIVIAITHLVADTGGGAALVETGGRKLAYATDIKLRAKSFSKWCLSGNDEPIGQEVVWQTYSTAIVAPGKKATSFIRYGVGIDETVELINLGLNVGLIDKAGAWLAIQYKGKSVKLQGQEQMRKFLDENPDVLSSLEQQINELLW